MASRQLLDREARRAAILQGAAAAFAERGFAATSMEDVAAAAGITKLIVYRHFASKQVLYDAVLERVADCLREELTTGLQTGRPGVVAVRAMLRAARHDPAGFTLLWRHAARESQFADHAEDIRRRGVEATEAILAHLGIDLGRWQRWAAATLNAYLINAVLEWLDSGDPADDERFVAMVSASLPGLIRGWASAID